MNISYDEEFRRKTAFFTIHPEYLPFVGDDYEKYRILQVGESHYINKEDLNTGGNNDRTADFLDNWWDRGYESFGLHREDFCTRYVVGKYVGGNRAKKFIVFSNVLKSFQNAVLNVIDGNRAKSTEYNFFAFMNFFQMPSIYKGESYVDALSAVNRETGASCSLKYAAEKSKEVFDEVVRILRPVLVVFTSKAAYRAFRACDGYEESDYNGTEIICTAHPGCKYWRTGNEGSGCFERQLKRIYGKSEV